MRFCRATLTHRHDDRDVYLRKTIESFIDNTDFDGMIDWYIHCNGQYDLMDVGIIAQEIKEVLPESIRENDTGYLSVRYEKIIPLLIESIKEQQLEINTLNKQITFLMTKK